MWQETKVWNGMAQICPRSGQQVCIMDIGLPCHATCMYAWQPASQAITGQWPSMSIAMALAEPGAADQWEMARKQWADDHWGPIHTRKINLREIHILELRNISCHSDCFLNTGYNCGITSCTSHAKLNTITIKNRHDVGPIWNFERKNIGLFVIAQNFS